jgi:hypothetical protein
MKFFSALLFFATFALASSAHAEKSAILFIDLNNAQEEIRAAQNAADNSDVDKILIKIPFRTPAQQKLLDELYSVSVPLSNKGLGAEAKKTLGDRETKIREELTKSIGHFPFTEEDVKRDFAAALEKNKVSTLIVSGDHAKGEYFGESGRISQTAITDVMLNHTDQAKAIRSIYGMGCYTGITANIKFWYRLMPNLEQVVGFDPQGPRRDRKPDLDLLRDSLIKEAKLMKDSDAGRDQKALRRAAQSVNGYHDTNAVICVCGFCTGSKVGDFSVSFDPNKKFEKSECTLQTYNFIDQSMGDFILMMDPETNDNEVPCDTGPASPLRGVYSEVEHYEECGDIPGPNDPPNPLQAQFHAYTEESSKLGGMIFFKNVENNFAHYNESDLHELSLLSKKYHFPMLDLTQPMACLGPNSPHSNVTRGTILKWVDSLGKQLPKNSVAPQFKEDKDFITKMKGRMETQLTSLDCVPAPWLREPSSSGMPDAPAPCCLPETMGSDSCKK